MAVDQSMYFAALANSLIHYVMPSRDSTLVIELVAFVYSSLTMCLQYLHLYRTAYWIPLASGNRFINSHLIDFNLVLFAALFSGRRLLWLFVKQPLEWLLPQSVCEPIVIVARSIVTCCIVMSLLYIVWATHLLGIYSAASGLAHAFPCVIYVMLFGFNAEPFMELLPANECYPTKSRLTDPGLVHSADMVTQCPSKVRRNASMQAAHFNLACRQAVFNGICCAFYGTFIPVLYAPLELYYRFSWTLRHIGLTFVGTFTYYIVQMVSCADIFSMHTTAKVLGSWTKVCSLSDGSVYNRSQMQWSGSTFWSRGNIVRHNDGIYRAEGDVNASQPGCRAHLRFTYLFSDISYPCWITMLLQSGVVHAQHLSLIWSTEWYMTVSETLFVFANYYILFKVVRNFFITIRMAPAIQDKAKCL